MEKKISKLPSRSSGDAVKASDLPIINFESTHESDLARKLKYRSLNSSGEYLKIVYELRTILEKTKRFKEIDCKLKKLCYAFGSCNSGFEVEGRTKKFWNSDPFGSHVMGLMFSSTAQNAIRSDPKAV